jgi:hypothetical protein
MYAFSQAHGKLTQGEFDDDADGEVSVGTVLTCGALAALLSQYTSLKHLDLSSNAFRDAEVRFCRTCCLRYLAV